jgi:hypothetical protein
MSSVSDGVAVAAASGARAGACRDTFGCFGGPGRRLQDGVMEQPGSEESTPGFFTKVRAGGALLAPGCMERRRLAARVSARLGARQAPSAGMDCFMTLQG